MTSARPGRPSRGLIAFALPLMVALAVVSGCRSTKSAAPVVANTTPSGPASTDTTAPATTGTGVTSVHATPGNEAFCQVYLAAVQSVAAVAATAAPNDSAGINAEITVFKAAYAKIDAAAPSDIKSDFDTVNAKTQAAGTADELAIAVSDPQVSAANDRIQTWTTTNCGFDPNNVTAP